MALVGGLRARLISDSFHNMVSDCLDALDWFDSGRQHEPITVVRGEPNWDEPIPANTLAISNLDVSDLDAEMGSNLTDDRWTFFIDFVAENDSIGTHVAGDIRDILRGKFPSIGRTAPNLEVLDYREATPPTLFYCDIENVVQDRAQNAPSRYLMHWWALRCEVVDSYGDEDY